MSPPDDAPDPPTRPDEPRRHPVRWVVGGALVLVAVVVGIVIALFLARDEPEAKDLDEALDAYRSTSTVAVPSEVRRPAAGVYLAAGEGREELSFPPIGQDDGDEMPLTITRQGGG